MLTYYLAVDNNDDVLLDPVFRSISNALQRAWHARSQMTAFVSNQLGIMLNSCGRIPNSSDSSDMVVVILGLDLPPLIAGRSQEQCDGVYRYIQTLTRYCWTSGYVGGGGIDVTKLASYKLYSDLNKKPCMSFDMYSGLVEALKAQMFKTTVEPVESYAAAQLSYNELKSTLEKVVVVDGGRGYLSSYDEYEDMLKTELSVGVVVFDAIKSAFKSMSDDEAGVLRIGGDMDIMGEWCEAAIRICQSGYRVVIDKKWREEFEQHLFPCLQNVQSLSFE